jgi:hypothetical protein
LTTHIYGIIVLCMKTTLELPDDLLIEAKKRAAELRVPLRQLLEEGLRTRLDVRKRQARTKRRTIRWVTVPGGLPRGLDVSDREKMSEYLMRGGKAPPQPSRQPGVPTDARDRTK